MRRHRKASSAKLAGGSVFSGFAVAFVIVLLAVPVPGVAATVTDRPFLFSFDGSGTTAGKFVQRSSPTYMGVSTPAVDAKSGDVYVLDAGHEVVDRFDSAGKAKSFPSLGSSSLTGPPGKLFKEQNELGFSLVSTDIAVDNSGGSGGPGEGEQGRLYVAFDRGPIDAFDPNGGYLWTLSGESFKETCGITVDTEGHLWVGGGNKVLEFASSGSPPAQIGSFTATKNISGPCPLAIDQSGKTLYAPDQWPNFGAKFYKYVSGSFDSTVSSSPIRGLAIDQTSASGHIFALEDPGFLSFASSLSEYEPCSTAGCGAKTVLAFGHALIADGRGLAYNPSLDRLYVSDKESETVKVFGPLTTGTAPDASIQPTVEIGGNEATAAGSVNPNSVPNGYHFEYKRCETAACTAKVDNTWGLAKASAPACLTPPPPLSEDSNPHKVTCKLTGLLGNTTYQVRLVATNSSTQLSTYSAPDTFKTLPPPLPDVSVDSISAVTTNSAHLSGTVNPHGDQTSWRILITAVANASKAECEAVPTSSFEVVEEGTIPNEQPGSVTVEANLVSLLPGQTYCGRITATNGGGTGTGDGVFRTQEVPPSNVRTAFAAPRTDVTARVNGYVSPEADGTFKYRFELSEDGTNWQQLPEREIVASNRFQMLLGEDLTGLTPNTTYHFRLAYAANAAGSTPGTGETIFTTRSTPASGPCPNEAVRVQQHATYLPDCRAQELVNSPEKGDQNAFLVRLGTGGSPLSGNGESVLWTVFGGAPGGATGTGNAFLARRRPSGWHSLGLVPPATEQVGGGDFEYKPAAANADFSSFVFNAQPTGLLVRAKPPTFVRLDTSGHQQVLGHFASGGVPDETDQFDVSDDTAHVLHVDPATGHLLDIGSGSPEVVGVMQGGLPPQCGASLALSDALKGSQWLPGYHRFGSPDDSRLVFQTSGDSNCNESPEGLYLRNRETETTIEIAGEAELIRALPNGAVYFISRESLTAMDENSGAADIYRWSESQGDECLTCVIANPHLLGSSSFSFANVLVSDDGSHVYFESHSRLVSGLGEEGKENLYALSNGALRYVASPEIGNTTLGGNTVLAGLENAQLSADGEVLAFLSIDPVTTDQVQCSSECAELYRYDDADGSLECVSCLHGGVTKEGTFSPSSQRGEMFELSSDGKTFAFTTSQGLLLADVNHRPDLYRWREGQAALITNGVTKYFAEGSGAPAVRAIGSNGRDIVFTVAAPDMTGFEEDGLANVYDAREDGGFLLPTPAAACNEDSCQGPLVAPPPSTPPSSTNLVDPGNVKEATRSFRCRSGKVRRHGRCVKPKHRGHRNRGNHANRRGMQ